MPRPAKTVAKKTRGRRTKKRGPAPRVGQLVPDTIPANETITEARARRKAYKQSRLEAQQQQAAYARIAKARHARDAARLAYLDATETLIEVETANGVSDTAVQEFRRHRVTGH